MRLFGGIVGARILLLLTLCLTVPAWAQPRNLAVNAVEQRVALVIGNDSYQHVGKLDNARADARAIARGLEASGFKVTLKLDQPEKAMKESLRAFKSQISGGAVAVFYYSGHGVQLGAANYLLPIDIRGDNEDQVKDEAIPLQRILDDLQDQKTKFSLAIIDACRNNPFRTSGRAIGGRGLAPTTAATGQMVLFSAGTGQQALDRLGPHDKTPNGLFTRVLLKEMRKPGIPADRVLRNVREEVVRLAKTVNHEQVPAIYDQALGDFYFHPGTSQASSTSESAPPRVQSAAEIEQELWDSIKESRDVNDFKEYLSSYPSGRFTLLARARVRTLSSTATSAAAAKPVESAPVTTASSVAATQVATIKPPEAQRIAVTGGAMQVDLATNLGKIRLELYPDKAPKSVENFIQYVKEGHYNGTIFHRVIPGFMVQGGGFNAQMSQKPTRPPIPIESKNGLKNDVGTVAMARTSDPNSATAQFFINVSKNDFLNYPGQDGNGYTVFGKVVDGMDVVNKIVGVPTGNKGMHQNVPNTPVVIESAKVVEKTK